MKESKLEKEFEIKEDPDIKNPDEKEFVISATKTELNDDSIIKISSNIGTMMRNLLKHNSFMLDDYSVKDNIVVSVKGRLPISCLKIKPSPRKKDILSTVF